MKATELRIGNWVYNSTTRNNMQVYPMMIPQLCNIEKEYGSLKDSNIKPIPLTEEILLKLPDFERLHQSLFKTRDGKYSLHETISSNWIFYRDSTNLCFIKSLHQLQNLFYALAGEELEVKL